MKILFLSTTDIEGGAAIASFRLFQALKKSGLDVKMLVGQKLSDDKDVVEIWKSNIKKYISCGLHISEKLKLLMNINNRKDIFFFSTGEFGTDISKHPLVQEADVIHYHWINHTFLSLKNLEKILATGKQVISHLHDMWAFTGGCHYAGECENFIKSCGNCPMLSSPSSNDISFQIHVMKQKLYNAPNLSFITSSVYLKNIAEKSSLLKNKEITALPIPIDTDFYKRTNFICARKKFNLSLDKSILLFGAHNISHSRKGFKYFIEAVNKLESENRDFSKNVEVAVFGKCKENLQNYFKVKVNNLGVLNLEQIKDAYSAADVFVIPSLEDNLPNTILESLSCETPVVAFKTGGIPEMINHLSNGFLADYKSSDSIAEGIMWGISYKPEAKLNLDLYSIESVVLKYNKHYNFLLNRNIAVNISVANPVLKQENNFNWALGNGSY